MIIPYQFLSHLNDEPCMKKKQPAPLQKKKLDLHVPFDIFPTRCNITQFLSGKLLYMFRVVFPPIIRSTHNCFYSIWYLLNRYCYLPLLWKSWNCFECRVGNVFICFGAVATAPKQINTIPTPHSNQFQLFHNSGK